MDVTGTGALWSRLASRPLRCNPSARVLSAFICGLFFLFAVFALAACDTAADSPANLIQQMETRLARVKTVQGRLDIVQGQVALDQEFWLQRPSYLRTETESGPGPFQGVIVALNDREGWVYSPSLNLVTLVDRSGYTPDLAGEAGAGSSLERLPGDIQSTLRRQYPIHKIGRDTVAGRRTDHWEIIVPEGDASFPPGPLHIWLDTKYSYPLALRDGSGREIRFRTVVFNQAIDPLVFAFVPPPGTLVQRVKPGD